MVGKSRRWKKCVTKLCAKGLHVCERAACENVVCVAELCVCARVCVCDVWTLNFCLHRWHLFRIAGGPWAHRWHGPTKTHLRRRENVPAFFVLPSMASGQAKKRHVVQMLRSTGVYEIWWFALISDDLVSNHLQRTAVGWALGRIAWDGVVNPDRFLVGRLWRLPRCLAKLTQSRELRALIGCMYESFKAAGAQLHLLL